MKISIKAKIWSTVSAVVFLFAYFIYFYFPNQQKEQVLISYNKDTQNLANTVALGVQIALDEQNFRGVKMAMDFIKKDSNLVFVSIVQVDDSNEIIFNTFPETFELTLPMSSSDSIIVKKSNFQSELLSGKIILGISTKELKEKHNSLRQQAMIITLCVLFFGVSIGYLLARNISVALNLIKLNSSRVAQGNLGVQINMKRKDEIGDLSAAFDKMVKSLSEADNQLQEYNEELKTKSEQIEHNNEKTQESIRYAKVIQQAFLPKKSEFRKVFSDSFISYLPKDIVSGDFYYFAQSNKNYVFGVFDCTGHGIPGGFMSVMGCVYLKNIILNQGITEPSKILELLDEGIVESLNQKDEKSKSRDGMDGSLCSLNLENNKLKFSGAFNSLYILRGDHWIKIKADRKSVGGGMESKMKGFSCSEIYIEKGDLLYMFSDGFVDQFGGKHGRKYMLKKLQQFIFLIRDYPMKEQQQFLEKEFYEWKGNEIQLDDVLVMGIRI